MADLSDAQIEWRNRARADFRFFCKHMQIKPKKDLFNEETSEFSTLIPFEFNEVQELIWKQMQECIAQRRPMEFVICKARQFGVSTFFCAFLYWNMWRSTHRRCAIVAHQDRTLQALLSTVNLFHMSLPEGYRPQLREKRKDARITKEGVNMVDRDSTCIIVPQSPDALRGPNFDDVLTTEVSSFKNAADFYQGFVPAMNAAWYRLLVKESSPKDGYFREEYERASRGDTKAIAMFFEWWRVRSLYWLPLIRKGRAIYDATTEERVKFDSEEREEQKQLSRAAAKKGCLPIADEQMYWRQQMIERLGGDVEAFNTEFPRDDVSCFEQATRSAFKFVLPNIRATVEASEDECGETIAAQLHSDNYDPAGKDYDSDSVTVSVIEDARFDAVLTGDVSGMLIFDLPKAGYTYCVGGDVSDPLGVEEDDNTDTESAYSVGCVYCCNTRSQVAEWRGHIDPHDFGDILVMLGYLYNTAMICVERNNMGITTEDRIMRYLMYPLTFRWPDFGSGGGKLTSKAMWETNARTKMLMIGELRVAIRDGLFKIRSVGLYDECSKYIVKGGKYKAGPGAYADRIVAAALSWQCVQQTDYGYGSIVLGSAQNDGEKSGARRVLTYEKTITQPPRRLPDEFGDDIIRVEDPWATNDWGVPKELVS